MVNCDHGGSTTSRFDSPQLCIRTGTLRGGAAPRQAEALDEERSVP
eukprot:COSAG01_NODE_68237_length_264_cov_1.715152_1_plen_45_part_10